MKGNKIIDSTTHSTNEQIESTDRHNEILQYHNNLKHWKEIENNFNKEELKNIDQFNYSPNKNYDKHVRQPTIYRRKVSLNRSLLLILRLFMI